MNTEYNTGTGVPILKESYNSFKFYASGRVFTKWMLVNMDVRFYRLFLGGIFLQYIFINFF
jgi:hypothetical protein